MPEDFVKLSQMITNLWLSIAMGVEVSARQISADPSHAKQTLMTSCRTEPEPIRQWATRSDQRRPINGHTIANHNYFEFSLMLVRKAFETSRQIFISTKERDYDRDVRMLLGTCDHVARRFILFQTLESQGRVKFQACRKF